MHTAAQHECTHVPAALDCALSAIVHCSTSKQALCVTAVGRVVGKYTLLATVDVLLAPQCYAAVNSSAVS
eukprot:18787-Heterococcus_DN1.PRE.3